MKRELFLNGKIYTGELPFQEAFVVEDGTVFCMWAAGKERFPWKRRRAGGSTLAETLSARDSTIPICIS